MSMMNDFVDNGKNMLGKLAVIGSMAATMMLAGTDALAQGKTYKDYEDLEPGETMPGNYFYAGFTQQASNHSLYNGRSFVVGGAATLNKARTLELDGGYRYAFEDPNTVGFGYRYRFNGPYGTTTGATAYSWSPNHAHLHLKATTPPSTQVKASIGAGPEAYFGQQNNLLNTANFQAKAELGVNVLPRDKEFNLFLGAYAEITHINQNSFNMTRYQEQDKQNATVFGIKVAGTFQPRKEHEKRDKDPVRQQQNSHRRPRY